MERRSKRKTTGNSKNQYSPLTSTTTSRYPSRSTPSIYEVSKPSHTTPNTISQSSSEPLVNTPLPSEPPIYLEIQTIIQKIKGLSISDEQHQY